MNMARPRRCRRVCMEPEYISFGPDGTAQSGQLVMSVDEYEVIRLVDLEGKTHGECAKQMDISRTTVTEIYESARKKLAECLVSGYRLEISGGSYIVCEGAAKACCGAACRLGHKDKLPVGMAEEKGEETMRIAVTYENGQIFQHFGHTAQFKIYDVEDGVCTKETVVDTNGSGHGALAGFLLNNQVDALICGGIGGGAQMALKEAGITLYGGVSGDADEAVRALIKGELGYNPNVQCNHHGEHHHGEHHHGEHACGSHGCGSNSCH